MKKNEVALLIFLALAAGFVVGNEYQKRKKRIINALPQPDTEGGVKGTVKRIVF